MRGLPEDFQFAQVQASVNSDPLALFRAARCGDLESVKLQLDNQTFSNSELFSCLLTAIVHKHAPVVEFLISEQVWAHGRAGSMINPSGSREQWINTPVRTCINPGSTCLHLACDACEIKTIELLLNAGVNLDAITVQYDSGIGEEGGWTALDVSESHQHTAAIDLLKQHSAPEGSRGPGSSDNWRNDSFSHAWKDPVDRAKEEERVSNIPPDSGACGCCMLQ